MGLLFDLFKAEDAEVEFIVTGQQRLICPVFLARLEVLEVGVDTFSIGAFDVVMIPHSSVSNSPEIE